MKIIVLLFLAGLFSREPAGLQISDTKVVLIIDKNTTAEDLKYFKSELWSKKGITFDVYQISRDAHDMITFIEIKVDCHDGQFGSASYRLTNSTRIGFIRDYKTLADQAFAIGNIDKE